MLRSVAHNYDMKGAHFVTRRANFLEPLGASRGAPVKSATGLPRGPRPPYASKKIDDSLSSIFPSQTDEKLPYGSFSSVAVYKRHCLQN